MLSELRYFVVNSIIRNINLANSSKCLIKLNGNCLLKSYQIQAPILQARYLCSKYYSKKKIQVPDTILVNKSNSHLNINLYDEHDKQIGIVSMGQANSLAKSKELKLVLVDESQDTPKFRLMNGKELAKLRVETKNRLKEEKGDRKNLKEKTIQVRVKCSEHDLQHKLNQIKEFYDKGYPIKIIIDSKLKNLLPTEVEKIQGEFVKNLKTKIDYTPLALYRKNEQEVIFLIENKKNENSEEKSTKPAATAPAKSDKQEEQKEKQTQKSAPSTGKSKTDEQKEKQTQKSAPSTGKSKSDEQKEKQTQKSAPSAGKPKTDEQKEKQKTKSAALDSSPTNEPKQKSN